MTFVSASKVWAREQYVCVRAQELRAGGSLRFRRVAQYYPNTETRIGCPVTCGVRSRAFEKGD